DVVKVEPVAGDPLRRFTATGAAPPKGTDAPLFSYLNSGKRSVTAASGSLGNLLARADVVIVTATRAAAIERGFDLRGLLGASPRSAVVAGVRFRLHGALAGRPAGRGTR